jgi:hypothetical protein
MPLAGRGRVDAVVRRLSRLGFEPTAGGAALAANATPLSTICGPRGNLNHPEFDAHLLCWEGASHAEQVRPGDAGQGCPSGA